MRRLAADGEAIDAALAEHVLQRFLPVVGAGLRAQRLPVRTGREAMLGKIVPALDAISPIGGKVFVEGEYWNAVSDTPVQPGQVVQIVSVNGLTLKVKPKT